jgi:subtilisin-like proprotein convertase family protein
MKQILTLFLCCLTLGANSQSFYRTVAVPFAGNGQTKTDTLNVTGLSTPTLNSGFGLDSITLKLNYSYDEDLLISLTAPDGTVLQLANNLGGGGSNFTNTQFTMSVAGLVNMSDAPFTGKMRPESWMGRVNNGQNGNGKWVLKIINTTTSNNSGSVVKWGLHFDHTPAPPEFFTTSSLPIVVINTNNVIPQHDIKNEVNGTMGIINNTSLVNTIGNPFNDYNGDITIKVRGNTSADFPQQSFTISTVMPSGDDSNAIVLGMSAGSDWVLYGAWDDKALIRDVLTYQMSNEMGAYAPRTHLCELVINGDYKGVYAFMEKIKRGDGRVPVEKMSTTTTSGSDLTGGYIFQVDRGDDATDHWVSNYPPCAGSNGDISFVYEYPSDTKINSAQKTYIAHYVDSFEAALATKSLYDTTVGYRHYINATTFMQQSILQELGHNVDGYRLSSFLYKAKNGKLCAGPIWDFNLAYGNADYYDGSATNTYEWDLPCPASDGNLNPFWWKKFSTDTSYMSQYKCLYTNLRQTALDTDRIDHIIDSFRSVLAVPETRNFQRWPIMGIYLWPNQYVGTSWQDETNYMQTWIHERVRWMDSMLYVPTCIAVTPPPAAINDVEKETLVHIYPNPTNDVLNIDGKNVVISRVQIFNITGQMVLDEKENQSHVMLHIGGKNLSAGIYTVSVETKLGMVRKKLVIQ